MIKPSEPIKKEVVEVKNGVHYDYYWFVIIDSVYDPSALFDYEISLGRIDGGNPDMFISLIDGRNPTEFDYDIKSDMDGADSIRINRASPVWERNAWEPRAGIVAVVGVKVTEPTTYNLVLSE